MVIALGLAVIAQSVVIAVLAYAVLELRREVEDYGNENHAKCIAHVADMTSKRIVAMALRDAAKRYDTVAEKGTIGRLARNKFHLNEGPSLPSLWMLHQADLLDGEGVNR